MDGTSSHKLTGIRQIVRLKGLLRKLQSVTLGQKAKKLPPGGIAPLHNKRLANAVSADSDGDSFQSSEPPPDVPKGYLAVYVGPELRRFIIPTSYLRHSVFKVLLEKAEEEFGFDHNGGLTLPCEIETFKYLLKCIENHPNSHPDDDTGYWTYISGH